MSNLPAPPPDLDPEAVLAYVKAKGLVDADCTVEQLPPAAFRLYTQWGKPLQDAERRRRDEWARDSAEYAARARELQAAEDARRARRDRIRKWAEAHGYRVGRSVPPAVVRAYEVAVEGGDGQPSLF